MNTKDNKYHTWYNSLVERARNRAIEGYVERHHIIPKSLGGTDESSNIVALTAREHLIAHMLLPRFVEQPGKMWCALWGMMNRNEVRVTCRLYEQARIGYAETLKGRKRPEHSAFMKKHNPMKGKKRPEHSATLKGKKRPKISAALRGRKRPDRSAALKGSKLSEETKTKISAALKGRKFPERAAAMIGRKRPDVSAALKERWAKKKQPQALLSHSPN